MSLVPRTLAASRNPQKTASSRERRACQNVQQSLKKPNGRGFRERRRGTEMAEKRCPGRPGGVPWGRPGGVPGCPWDRCPGAPPGRPVTPRDAPDTRTPPGRPRTPPCRTPPAGTPRDAPGTPPHAAQTALEARKPWRPLK